MFQVKRKNLNYLIKLFNQNVLNIVFILPIGVFAQKDISALFIGNSYTATNNLPNMIDQLAKSAGNKFSYQAITPGGFSWVDHRYSSSTVNTIQNVDYDYLVLQEQSLKMALNEYGFAKHQHLSFSNAQILNHHSKAPDTCRKTLLYLTWGRKNGSWVYEPGGNFGLTYQDMQDYLTENFLQLSSLLNAGIAPVGEAWRKAMNDYPSIELYASDGSHPSIAGTYLAACVFYTALFQESSSLAWKPADLTSSDAQALQLTADAILLGAYSQWNIENNGDSCSASKLRSNAHEWQTDTLPNSYLSEINFLNEREGMIKAAGPLVWRTVNAGETWTRINLPEKSDLSSDENSYDIIQISKDSLCYVIATDDVDSSTVQQGFEGATGSYQSYLKVFFSSDGGISWTEKSPLRVDYQIDTSGTLSGRHRFWNFSIDFEKNGRIGSLLCYYEYTSFPKTIYSFTTTDGGLNWKQSKVRLQENFTGKIWSVNSSEFYVGGFKFANATNDQPLKLLGTKNSGNSWSTVANLPSYCCQTPTTSSFNAIAVFRQVSEDTLLAINGVSSPTLFRSIDGGLSWDSISTIKIIGKVNDIYQTKSGWYYLLVNNGPINRILVSKDFGTTWQLENSFKETLSSITATKDFIYAVGEKGKVHRKFIGLTNIDPVFNHNSTEIIVFPNPSNGLINMHKLPLNSIITVYNSTGALIDQQENKNRTTIQFRTKHLNSGIYFIKTTHPSRTSINKLLITN